MNIYTFGYVKTTVAQLKEWLEQNDAALVDIRFSANSRNPDWAKSNLSNAVGVARYTHLKAWGNENYKGGPIKLVNFDWGLQLFRTLPFSSVALMCACGDPTSCHRTTVANMLRAQGYEVNEIAWSKAVSKPTKPAPQLSMEF